MVNQSPKSNSNTSAATTQSAGQNLQQQQSGQQQPQSSGTSSIDAAATVDPQQQQSQQPGGPGRPTSSLGQQQQQYPPGQQRWPSEIMPPGSSTAGPMPPGMMLASPHYPAPPQQPQQYAHPQQQVHLLGVPSPSPYGYGAPQPSQQHSPNSANRASYPSGPPQMLHPAMMYPPPHGYGPPPGASPYGHPQQYWASRNGPIGGAPGMMGPPTGMQNYPALPQQQSGQPGSHETPSTSRHTPQPATSQSQMPAPSPSMNTSQQEESSMEENAGHRPRSSQSQHQFTTPQGQPQQPPPQQIPPQPSHLQQPQIRYTPAAAMLPPQMAPGQFQPPPMAMGHHPGMGPGPPSAMHPQMQAAPHHHMQMAQQMQMHPHHPGAGPFPGHPGMYFAPQPPHHPSAVAVMHHSQQAPPPPVGILPGLKPAQREAVEKLVIQLANPKQQMSPEMVYERRLFYERLVLLNEQQGEVLGGPPQVSKSTVDLFALYKAVKQKGGFEKTIRDKIWKNLCTDANIEMQQSSAAGFQLRKHYQKYLLKLECMEGNLNAQELIEFAEKQKKKKKEKESKDVPANAAGTSSAANAGQSSAPAGPETPSSSSSNAAAGAGTGGKDDPQQRPPPTHPAMVNGPPQQQTPQFAGYPPPHGMGLPPGVAYPGPEFPGPPPTSGGYPMPGQQFGQYPPPPAQWAAYPQQMPPAGIYLGPGQKTPQQMRPPHQQQPYPGQQTTEDDQQQQQYQQRLGGSSSRLSATSTPAPATDHPSRASSVAGSAQEKQECSRDEEQRIGGGGDGAGQVQHQQRQAPTPSSSFSANAPTPPLTTSAMPMPGGVAQTPSTATQMHQQQMTPAPTGYYHPAAHYGRYPPSAAGQPGEMYAAGPGPGMYGAPQQPPLWGSPYGMPPHHQARYHPPPPGAPAGRYPPYAIQSAHAQQQQPIASNSPQQQSATAGQQQAGKASMIGTPKTSAYPPYGPTSARAAAPSNAPGPMALPPSMPMPAYAQPPIVPTQQFQAWFGSAAMSTQPPPFPPQSLEAQTIAQIQQQQQSLQTQQPQRFRRPKIYSRDLYGATPTRIVMALRSALHLETCWALNALNIQLYDDTITSTMHQPSLTQTPELLNLIVEHFAAVLSLLFPKHFDASTIDWCRSPEPSSTLQADKMPKKEPIEAANRRNENGKETVALMVRPPQSSANNNNMENAVKTMPNFTMISRLGRRVKLDQTEIPPELAEEMLKLWKGERHLEEIVEDEKGCINDEKNEDKTFPKFLHRIRHQMIQQIHARRKMNQTELFKKADEEECQKKKDFWEEEEKSEMMRKSDGIKEKENIIDEKIGPRLFYRQPKPWERWDRHGMDECALITRPTVLQNQHADELLEQLVDRCLALSNILRGFSFLPGQERQLAQHTGLLRLLPALLMLMVDEQSQRKRNGGIGDDGNNGPKQFTFPRPPPAEEQQEGKGTEDGKPALPTRQAIPPEHDCRRKWLLEVANQLRDDAFTILAHISPNLDLFDMDSTISLPIFDSLLHWSVSMDLQARDPLPPYGAIPPRHYALEIICKMSVLERNVDLLVSTGPWPRIEEFVRLLCSLICEEPPVREFAIVILNAICGACEPICYIAAVETDLLEHLVAFLEAADANMTQIAQHQGIHTLRENPEIIGTSVGMLRRAALILVHIVKHQNCRDRFHRLQHRLLQFTVSHFMDSRVAAMVADILFEIQRDSSPRKGEIGNGKSNDEQQQQYLKESIEMNHPQNKESESSIGHGKLSSSAVFQPPAQMEPDLVFNGDETAATGITPENGGQAGNGVVAAAFCPTTAMADPPPIENNNNHHNRANKKRTRKRRSETPDSSASSSTMLAENSGGGHHFDASNEHCNWNGHAAGNGGDGTFEMRETIEKKKSKKQMVAASQIAGPIGESVREKMRNNILGKVAANQQQQKKRNGWIGKEDVASMPQQNGIAGDDTEAEHGHIDATEMDQQHSTTETKKPQMVGTPTSSPTNSTMAPGQTSATGSGTATNNNTNASQSGSLTAVA